MLQINKLEKKYKYINALDGVDLHIEDGSLFGMVGPNGAGKTTLIKVITGIVRPTAGSYSIAGIDAIENPQEVKGIIGYIPDNFASYDELTVYEYMEFFAYCHDITGLRARSRCEELLKQVSMFDRRDVPVSTLSKGMQQRVCLARALIHDPRFIIMDEPTNGLDPGTRHEFKEIVRELCAQGKTILISSHVLSELAEICTDIGIIMDGKMKVTGRVSDILDRAASANPIMVKVLDGEAIALSIFKKDACVKSISVHEKSFTLGFDGGKEDEAILLQTLIDNEIPVSSFVRKAGDLESFFMSITDKEKERLVLSSENEAYI